MAEQSTVFSCLIWTCSRQRSHLQSCALSLCFCIFLCGYEENFFVRNTQLWYLNYGFAVTDSEFFPLPGQEGRLQNRHFQGECETFVKLEGSGGGWGKLSEWLLMKCSSIQILIFWTKLRISFRFPLCAQLPCRQPRVAAVVLTWLNSAWAVLTLPYLITHLHTITCQAEHVHRNWSFLLWGCEDSLVQTWKLSSCIHLLNCL